MVSGDMQYSKRGLEIQMPIFSSVSWDIKGDSTISFYRDITNSSAHIYSSNREAVASTVGHRSKFRGMVMVEGETVKSLSTVSGNHHKDSSIPRVREDVCSS